MARLIPGKISLPLSGILYTITGARLPRNAQILNIYSNTNHISPANFIDVVFVIGGSDHEETEILDPVNRLLRVHLWRKPTYNRIYPVQNRFHILEYTEFLIVIEEI